MAPDEFVDWTMHVYMFVRKHIKVIAGVTGLVIVIFAGVMGGIYLSEYRANKAAKALYNAQEMLAGSSKQLEALEEVADKYGSTGSGRLALLTLGEELFKKGEYEAAATQFKVLSQKSKNTPLLQVVALHCMAKSLFALGEIEQAAQAYLNASQVPGNLNRDDSLYQAARCYEEMKNFDEARKIHSKVIDTGTNETTKSRSEERLLWLIARESRGS